MNDNDYVSQCHERVMGVLRIKDLFTVGDVIVIR